MAVTAEEMDIQNQALLGQDQGDGFEEASAAPVLVDDENLPAATEEQGSTVVNFLNQPAVQRSLPVIGGLLAIIGVIMAVAPLRPGTSRGLSPDMSGGGRGGGQHWGSLSSQNTKTCKEKASLTNISLY